MFCVGLHVRGFIFVSLNHSCNGHHCIINNAYLNALFLLLQKLLFAEWDCFLRSGFKFFNFLLAADKVHKKAENINERRNANRDRALQQMEKLKDQLQLHQFLQVMWLGHSVHCEHIYGRAVVTAINIIINVSSHREINYRMLCEQVTSFIQLLWLLQVVLIHSKNITSCSKACLHWTFFYLLCRILVSTVKFL